MSASNRRLFREGVGRVLVGFAMTSVVGLGAVPAARGQVVDAKSSREGEPTAESIVRQASDFIKQAGSFAVEVERVQKVGGTTIQSTCTVDFQRPNRFAFRGRPVARGPDPFPTVVSDGKKLYLALPALKKYVETDAAASFDAMLKGDPLVGAILQGTLTFVHFLCTDDPSKTFMQGVTSSRYVGLENREGRKVHHLAFTQERLDLDMWVAAEGDPIIESMVIDLTKSLAKVSGLPNQFKGQKVEVVQIYKNWRIGADLDPKTFAFEPPAGVEKVESFMAGQGGGAGAQEPISPLVGQPAPDVALKQLDGGDFRLKDHRDARLVLLDFWATWCGPCVMELPLLTEVAEAYKEKGVVFCAVNQREKTDVIEKFLSEKKLKFTVALDPEGQVGQSYHADAIPLLVLIDKKGVVQSVHLGYNPSIKTALAKELDDLLAGKDLAREAIARRDAEKARLATETKGLERAWSASGPYTSVAANRNSQSLFALRSDGRCFVLDREGKTNRTFGVVAQNLAIVRLARSAGGRDGLFSFGVWGPSVQAWKDDGTQLWEEVGGQGINDVWAADLDGDGSDEAIVGYNGATGLHVFGTGGKRLWKRTDLGNVWHVTAGDLDSDGQLEVVSTSAEGKVHVSAAADGRPLRTLDAGLYANMVRTMPVLTPTSGSGDANPARKGDAVLVIGQKPGHPDVSMVALGGDGKTLWSLDFPPSSSSCHSLAVTPDGTWAAAGLRDGSVCVIDVRRGRIIAKTAGQGRVPMVAWAAGADAAPPFLLVATGSELNAFHVKPVEIDPVASRPTLRNDPYYPLIVRGGSGVMATYESGVLQVTFGKADSAATADPKKYEQIPAGSAAWVDRPLNVNEPLRLVQKATPSIAEAAMRALRDSRRFWEFECRNTGSGYFEVLSSRSIAQPSD